VARVWNERVRVMGLGGCEKLNKTALSMVDLSGRFEAREMCRVGGLTATLRP
jgi:hypothetical protein